MEFSIIKAKEIIKTLQAQKEMMEHYLDIGRKATAQEKIRQKSLRPDDTVTRKKVADELSHLNSITVDLIRKTTDISDAINYIDEYVEKKSEMKVTRRATGYYDVNLENNIKPPFEISVKNTAKIKARSALKASEASSANDGEDSIGASSPSSLIQE